jgi:hypothetical protein
LIEKDQLRRRLKKSKTTVKAKESRAFNHGRTLGRLEVEGGCLDRELRSMEVLQAENRDEMEKMKRKLEDAFGPKIVAPGRFEEDELSSASEGSSFDEEGESLDGNDGSASR